MIYYLFFFFRSKRVCKKWNSLVKDSTLWSKIDLGRYKSELTLSDIKNLLNTYACPDSTRSIALTGNFSYDSVLNGTSTNTTQLVHDQHQLIYFLDTELIALLVRKCPNLTELQLEHLDLSELEMRSFFAISNLDSFSVRWCYSKSSWWSMSVADPCSRITNLQLIRSGSDKLAETDMSNICAHMPGLTTLSVVQTKSTITDETVSCLVKNCPVNLHTLELVNTLLTDTAVETLCRSVTLATGLKSLNLSMSSGLSNNCLAIISEQLHALKSLNLTSCFGISSIVLLQGLSNLSYLNINNTSLDKVEIRERLVPILAKCEIEFGHEKMLNRKLMWTINGSRNCVCSF
jgi:hypothetical protein